MFLPVVLVIVATPLIALVALWKVVRLERRLDDLEQSRPAARGRDRPPVTPGPVTPSRPSERREIRPSAPPTPSTPTAPAIPAVSVSRTVTTPRTTTGAAGGGGATPPTGKVTPTNGDAELEIAIGIRWYNIAGIVTLLFGVAFFLKYAYENAWIGPHGRVAIGILTGIGAMLVGERTLRRGHLVFAQGLTGGGLAALYLSIFFSFRLYQMIEIAPAFALLALVVACGVAIAVLRNTLAVAILSFAGGYLTPVLLSTGQDAAGFLFSYLTVLALGALGVACFRHWPPLNLLAFAGTCLLYAGWYQQHYGHDRLPIAIAGLLAFFLIFLIVPYANTLVRRLLAGPGDHALALGNAAFAFIYLYRMVHPLSPRALGFVALGLAALYLALGALSRRRVPADHRLAAAIFGISITFLTLAVPLQLGLHAITLAWAVQGLLLIWIGFRYREPLTRLAGWAVTGLAVLRLFIVHTPLHAAPFTLFLNASFGTWAWVAAAIFGAAWLYRRNAEEADEREGPAAASTCVCAGSTLLLLGLNLEIWPYFRFWGLSPQARAGGMMVLWSLYPLAALCLAMRLRDRLVHRLSLFMMAGALLPFLILLSTLGGPQGALFGRAAFWAGLLGVGSFFAAGMLDRRAGGTMLLDDLAAHRLLSGAGTTLLFVLLTAEVYTFFRYRPGDGSVDPATNSLRALLAVSILWAAFASVLMVLGFRRSDRSMRIAAAGLFTLTLVKVFFMDVWELREVYRILSFIVLGLLLVAASYLYSRLRTRITGAGLIVALVALAGGGEVRAGFDPSHFSHVRAIETAQVDQSGEPFAWVTLDGAVLDVARADLADLRIVGRGLVEVPHVVHRLRGGSRDEAYAPRVINRARVDSGRGSSIELDFAGRAVTNLLQIESSGDDFRRRVMVEGSDDGRDWRTIVEDAWIYRIPPSGAFEGIRQEAVSFPDNDQPRLRVTVFAMPDEKGPVDLRAVRAFRRVVIEPETSPLPIASYDVVNDDEARTTRIDIDLGHRHARPASLRFDFREEAFRRAYRVTGRNEISTTVTRGRTETGEAVSRTLEAPWERLGSGTFFRLPPGRDGAAGIDRTEIAFSGAAVRYLRVLIENNDDRPLRVRGLSARAHVQRVIFPLRPRAVYSLYYGNADASTPHYDLPALLPDLEEHTPVAAALGPAGANPLFGNAPERPFTERHPWILWIVLLAALATLATVAARSLRGATPRGA